MPFYPIGSKFMWFWNFFIPFTRFWGIMTAMAICGAGIDVLIHYNFKGIYIIAASFIVLFLEITWLFSHFLRFCTRKNNGITHVWNTLNVKHWQKSVLYLPLSVTLFLNSYRQWLSFVVSAMVTILACLHVLLCFRDHKKNAGKRTLLLSEEDYQERNEEVIFEILDNSIRSKDDLSVEEPGGPVLDI